MQLPGGVSINGHLTRDFQFALLTGEFELVLGEQFATDSHHVDKVTDVLHAALKRLGDADVSRSMIEDMSVGDRQFLMRRLASELNDQPVWLTAQCNGCEESFDVSYKHSELPVKLASKNYPIVKVNSSLGDLLVRVPTGRDQREIARSESDQQALEFLLQRIVRTASENKKIDPIKFSDIDRKEIEQSLENAAPEVATELISNCPYCNHENRIPLDPYNCLTHKPDDLFDDLHHIAMHYHWDEKTILNLPRSRRKVYLKLIDSSRGMTDSSAGPNRGQL